MPFHQDCVDILIVTALPEELKALGLWFDLNSPITSNNPPATYYSITIDSTDKAKSYRTAATCLYGMGNTKAAVGVTNALQTLTPSYVFMFGLAAGIENRVAIKDVIISETIIYYGLGKQTEQGRQIRPETIPADNLLKQRLYDFSLMPSLKRNYTVAFGPFAVGETVISAKFAVDEILQQHPKVLGIEMESYGVGLAVVNFSSPPPKFIAVRGVSDHADATKNDDGREEALQNAADFLMRFIQSGLLDITPASDASPLKSIAIHHTSLYRQPSIQRIVLENGLLNQPNDLREIVIDQTEFFSEDGILAKDFLTKQEAAINQINELLMVNPNTEINYFGLAHIPLVFHLGYKINRRQVKVFASQRQSGGWVSLAESGAAPEIVVEGMPQSRLTEVGDVAIRVSISYSVLEDSVLEVCKNPLLASIHISAKQVKVDLIENIEALDSFIKTFQSILQEIQNFLPNTRRIHLFFAGPATVAFCCGQQINRSVDPDVLVYSYSRRTKPNYCWGLNLHTGEIVTGDLVVHQEDSSG